MGCTSSKNNHVEEAHPLLPPRPDHGTAQSLHQPLLEPESILTKLKGYSRDDQRTSTIRIVSKHLLKIITCLNESREAEAQGNADHAKRLWAQVYESLAGKEGEHVAGQLSVNGRPYEIQLRFGCVDPQNTDYPNAMNKILKKGFHSADTSKFILPDVAFVSNGGLEGAETAQSNSELAWTVLPVMLEEWIHLFQSQLNDNEYLSNNTIAFANSNAREIERKGWDLKEVDVYATYRQLGWTSILAVFQERYGERVAFETLKQTKQPNIERGLLVARSY